MKHFKCARKPYAPIFKILLFWILFFLSAFTLWVVTDSALQKEKHEKSFQKHQESLEILVTFMEKNALPQEELSLFFSEDAILQKIPLDGSDIPPIRFDTISSQLEQEAMVKLSQLGIEKITLYENGNIIFHLPQAHFGLVYVSMAKSPVTIVAEHPSFQESIQYKLHKNWYLFSNLLLEYQWN